MKNSIKLFTMSLVMISLACGAGKNSIEAKKASLEQLKKQALELNAKISTLEKELERKKTPGSWALLSGYATRQEHLVKKMPR